MKRTPTPTAGAGWLRPCRPGQGALVLVLLVMAFLGISTTTGTGWPIVLVSLQVGVLVMSFVLPVFPLARARVEIGTPGDATVGLPLTIDVVSRGPGGVKAWVPALDRGWFRLGTGELSVVPPRRGVLDAVAVELRCASPLGLWPWRRRIVVPLDHALCIAPRALDVALSVDADVLHRGDELTRGVRPYDAGDALRDVHWPATARTGTMQVREREVHERATVHLVADLGATGALAGERVEERASWAVGAGIDLLNAGRELVVHTTEGGVPVSGLVRTRLELGRRLARATTGSVARPAGGIIVEVAEALP